MTRPPAVRLYARPGCHLCEDAETLLRALRRRYPHRLELVDVSADPGLLRRYGERIPVVALAGREYAAPLSEAVLAEALRHAR